MLIYQRVNHDSARKLNLEGQGDFFVRRECSMAMLARKRFIGGTYHL